MSTTGRQPSQVSPVIRVLFLGALLGQAVPRCLRADEPQEAMKIARALSTVFENVAQTITPSVVSVISVQKPKQRAPRVPTGPETDPFRQYFGDRFFERFFREMPDVARPQQGMGTGFVLDREGHILTNNHVVGGADEITVKLHDKRTLKAKVVGADPKTDLAVLKVDARDLVPAELGDSDKLKTGEWVVAAGNPFGLNNTITTGIVSAKGRSSLPLDLQYQDFIQTDAAINPGNSGGPLVGLDGRVVGINSAIASGTGGYMGIGFAIPINIAKSVAESLIKHGRVVRGWLGVGIQDVSKELAAKLGYRGEGGAVVGDVSVDGPADKAGVKSGDIVVRYDARPVENVNQLRFMVASTAPGTKVEVELEREGQAKSVTIKIGELKGEAEQGVRGEEEEGGAALGLSVEPLTADLARRFNAKTSEGVVVAEVSPFGLAANAGIQPNDIIVSVEGRKVSSAAEFQKEVKRGDLKKGVLLVVETGGMKHFVVLKSME
jgi:serine protease Do